MRFRATQGNGDQGQPRLMRDERQKKLSLEKQWLNSAEPTRSEENRFSLTFRLKLSSEPPRPKCEINLFVCDLEASSTYRLALS